MAVEFFVYLLAFAAAIPLALSLLLDRYLIPLGLYTAFVLIASYLYGAYKGAPELFSNLIATYIMVFGGMMGIRLLRRMFGRPPLVSLSREQEQTAAGIVLLVDTLLLIALLWRGGVGLINFSAAWSIIVKPTLYATFNVFQGGGAGAEALVTNHVSLAAEITMVRQVATGSVPVNIIANLTLGSALGLSHGVSLTASQTSGLTYQSPVSENLEAALYQDVGYEGTYTVGLSAQLWTGSLLGARVTVPVYVVQNASIQVQPRTQVSIEPSLAYNATLHINKTDRAVIVALSQSQLGLHYENYVALAAELNITELSYTQRLQVQVSPEARENLTYSHGVSVSFTAGTSQTAAYQHTADVALSGIVNSTLGYSQSNSVALTAELNLGAISYGVSENVAINGSATAQLAYMSSNTVALAADVQQSTAYNHREDVNLQATQDTTLTLQQCDTVYIQAVVEGSMVTTTAGEIATAVRAGALYITLVAHVPMEVLSVSVYDDQGNLLYYDTPSTVLGAGDTTVYQYVLLDFSYSRVPQEFQIVVGTNVTTFQYTLDVSEVFARTSATLYILECCTCTVGDLDPGGGPPYSAHGVKVNFLAGVWELYRSPENEYYTGGAYKLPLGRSVYDLNDPSIGDRRGETPVFIVFNPYHGAGWYNFTWIAADAAHTQYNFYFTPLVDDASKVVYDVMLFFEDLWEYPGYVGDNYVDHVFRVTAFANGTVRVQLVYASGCYAHMVGVRETPDIQQLNTVLQEYQSNGYVLPASYNFVYVKSHGAAYGFDPNNPAAVPQNAIWDVVAGQWVSQGPIAWLFS
jgi:hypothetical protein